MKVVVEDVNVLLDLVNGEILGHWLGIGFEHISTHLVWREVADTAHFNSIQSFVDSGLIQLRDIAPHEWGDLAAYSREHGASMAEASVWFIAKSERAVLLTGNSRHPGLRQSEIEIRGVLWVFDQLIEQRRVSTSNAAFALEKMLKNGALMPRQECQTRIAAWRAS